MKIFHEAKVKVFSVTETTGVKDEHDADLLDDWFGNKDGEYDSLIDGDYYRNQVEPQYDFDTFEPIR